MRQERRRASSEERATPASRVARVLPDEADASRSEAEQSAADADQTAADRDQHSSDEDQDAADRDQAASDRDFASGGDVATHEATKDLRAQTALRRDEGSRARMDSAARRDEIAHQRDMAAFVRDRAADAYDTLMDRADAEARRRDPVGGGATSELVRMAEDRRRSAATLRREAAVARALAAADRQAAAEDRERAAAERASTQLETDQLLRQLSTAETDALTGARVRAAGLHELRKELDRCRRTNRPLVVAYVDVVGLKELNDAAGHAAGDELLRRVVGVIMRHLRSYDHVVRLGGDEFLCVMSDATLRDARQRLEAIAASLTSSSGARAIRAGLAEARRDEDVTGLVARADAEMLRDRSAGRSGLRRSEPVRR